LGQVDRYTVGVVAKSERLKQGGVAIPRLFAGKHEHPFVAYLVRMPSREQIDRTRLYPRDTVDNDDVHCTCFGDLSKDLSAALEWCVGHHNDREPVEIRVLDAFEDCFDRVQALSFDTDPEHEFRIVAITNKILFGSKTRAIFKKLLSAQD
jgi:hypothetical protein